MREIAIVLTALVCLFFALSPIPMAEAQSFSAAPVSERLFLKSKQCLGKEMWKPGYGLNKGTLGCAAALCNVLKQTGVNTVHSAMVTVVRRQLLAAPNCCHEIVIRNGGGKSTDFNKAIDDALLMKNIQPGYILMAFMESPNKLNGGPNAHCGIMGKGTQVFTNNWNDGIWTEVEIHQMFDYYPYIRLLRFPQVEADKTGKTTKTTMTNK